ncbi:hypothetical protein, partial [Thermoleptolyngbya sp.]
SLRLYPPVGNRGLYAAFRKFSQIKRLKGTSFLAGFPQSSLPWLGEFGQPSIAVFYGETRVLYIRDFCSRIKSSSATFADLCKWADGHDAAFLKLVGCVRGQALLASPRAACPSLRRKMLYAEDASSKQTRHNTPFTINKEIPDSYTEYSTLGSGV